MRFSSLKEVETWAEEGGRCALLYKGSVIDATQFASMHPGGQAIVRSYANQDITEVFHDPGVHRHDYLSEQLLLSLEVGRVDDQPLAREGFLQEGEPLMHQVERLSLSEYLSLIKKPHFFGSSVRLFEMDFFEMFSHTAWPEVALVYSLALGFLLQRVLGHEVGWGTLVLYLLSCSLVWVLTEYLLHQFLFHSETYFLNRFYWFRKFHFCLHGIHHVLPLDKSTAHQEPHPFPPHHGVPILYLIAQGLGLVWAAPVPEVVTAGIITGYCFYDLWHYAMHNIKKGAFL
ncbi:uncharacterized protein LOC127594888, partial [Hippocampus zosterae]|uniref:uncharacterized protein LOC127594888 n=1 Tax=Hippocampus zosterae TaxID=109293 RepID=UPI00223D079B